MSSSSRLKKIVAVGFLVLMPVILLFGVTVAEATDNCFTDVSTGDWFHDFVCWMFDAGLTSGYPDGSFRPNNSITRAEVAVFMQQVAGAGSAGQVVDADKLDGFDSSYFTSQGSLDSHDHMVAQADKVSQTGITGTLTEVLKVTLDIPDKCTSFFAPFDEHNILVTASGYFSAVGGNALARAGVSMDDASNMQLGTLTNANLDSADIARSPFAVHWLFTDVGSGLHDFRLLSDMFSGTASSTTVFWPRLLVQQMGYDCGTLIITLEPGSSEGSTGPDMQP